ncbi:MAG: hypothetical protein M3144_04200 [Actinomycetota bacterium]|nr:hypothetical protein [Actinomycetota bacterium]
MRKKLAGLVLASTLSLGFAGPFVGPAYANAEDNDPELCFVIGVGILSEAVEQFRAGHLTRDELQSFLIDTALFVRECLTAPEGGSPPIPPPLPDDPPFIPPPGPPPIP